MSHFPSITTLSADVQELVEPYAHVCLPGEPVLRLGPRAVVAVGTGLHTFAESFFPSRGGSHLDSGTPGTEYKDVWQKSCMVPLKCPVLFASCSETLLAEHCAPMQRRAHPHYAHVNRYDVESPANTRYRPAAADPVVAIVVRRVGQQYFHCYIGASEMAYLDATAFDGASKTSRPRLVEGDVVYCYVANQAGQEMRAAAPLQSAAWADPTSNNCSGASNTALSSMPCDGVRANHTSTCMANDEITLSCTAAAVGLVTKDWTSGDAVFGPLEGGRVIYVPLPYARSLLTPHAISATRVTQRAPAMTTSAAIAGNPFSHADVHRDDDDHHHHPQNSKNNHQQASDPRGKTANSAARAGSPGDDASDEDVVNRVPSTDSASGTHDVMRPETGGDVASAADTHDAMASEEQVPASYLLELLGQHIPFEVCVGMNGIVWVRGRPSETDLTAETRRTVAVSGCILEGQNDVTRLEMEARVASYFPSV